MKSQNGEAALAPAEAQTAAELLQEHDRALGGPQEQLRGLLVEASR